MKIKNNRTLLWTSIMCIVPIVIGVLLWDKLPNEIPTHFDFMGNVDRYSSKTFAVFALPMFMLVINVFLIIVLDSDPKNTNQNNLMMNLSKWIVPIISIYITPITYLIAMGYSIDITTPIMIGIGVLFVVIGNYMPKIRQNYTIGIKLPWTLHSEVNWNRTHRLAGYTWMIAGIAMIIFWFIKREFFVYCLGIIIVITTLMPMVYSYYLYTKEAKSKDE